MMMMPRAQCQYDLAEFRHFSLEDGLSDNFITTMAFDSLGYLWIGTGHGLNRFDGDKFEAYTTFYHPDLVPGDYITRLELNEDQKLEVMTRNGCGLLNPKTMTPTFVHLHDTTALVDAKNIVYSLRRISEQLIAVTTATGFYVLNADQSLHFQYTDFVPDDVGKKRLVFAQDILKVSNDRWLISVRNSEYYQYTLSENSFKPLSDNDPLYPIFHFEDKDNWTIINEWAEERFIHVNCLNGEIKYADLSKGIVHVSHLPDSIYKDFYWDSYIYPLDDGHFAINCRDEGFFIFNLDTISGVIAIKGERQLSELRVFSILNDAAGRLVIGTTAGLYYQKNIRSFARAYEVKTPTDPLTNPFITDVVISGEKLITSTISPDHALLILDRKTMKVKKQIRISENQKDNEVFALRKIREEEIWCLTNGGVFLFNSENGQISKLNSKFGLSPGFITVSEMDTLGRLILSDPSTGKVSMYDSRLGSVSEILLGADESIRAMRKILIQGDVIWFGGKGLIKFNIQNHQLTRVFDQKDGLNINDLNILRLASNGDVLYMMTLNHGVIAYHTIDHKVSKIQPPDVVLPGIPAAMSVDIFGRLWYWLRGHMVIYDPATTKYNLYGRENNVPYDPSISPTRFDSVTGMRYASTYNQIIFFDQGIDVDKTAKKIIITRLDFGESTIHFPSNHLSLSSNQGAFKLECTQLDYGNEYSDIVYKIDDSDWYPSQSGVINIFGLKPGSHVINLRPLGAGIAETQTQLFLSIAQPFYRSWWFIALAAVVLTFILILWYFKHTSHIRNTSSLNLRIAEAEMQALHTQMNPHFLFNCLNSVKSLMLQSKTKEASHYLSVFSSLIRSNLDHSRTSFVSLHDQLIYLEKYLEMEKIRFPDIQYQIECEPNLNLMQIEIPARVLQPLVENAIWHGLQHINEEKQLRIRIQSNVDGTISCDVEDNGIGINNSIASKSDGASLALSNIRKRLALLNDKYHQQYKLELIDKSHMKSRGTLARFTFHADD